MANPLEEHLKTQLDGSRNFFWHRLRWLAISEWLPRTEEFELLDVGAGAGFAGEYLREDRPLARYRFIEPFRALEESLIDRFGAEGNFASRGRYDGITHVTLLDVLEHQEEDRKFIDDLVAKLDEGSLLLITVPAGEVFWSRWDEIFGHYRRYTKRTLGMALANPRLEILEMNYLFPEMMPLAILRKWTFKGDGANATEGDFPQISEWLNNTLIALGKLSLAVRTWVPFGTSLFAVVRVR